ncbi:hypothetical protein NKJ09_22595 [Mesorhizobium sp. M0189]|uniref:hypothetical protein n=1 Tax=Mesorhizobium sp. M0189 TaxID=2956909 RepID=UPI00333B4F8F
MKKTIEEMKELPIGPSFGQQKRVIGGKTVWVPVAPETKASSHDDDDVIGYSDETGRWQVGQYIDGSCFRRRVG